MLQVNDLHKKYGNEVALAGVTLSVARGEVVVLMGPSGCGKSTLLRSINRLVEPDEGEIVFDGQSVRDMDDDMLRSYRRRVGFVFQHFNLIARLSVLENVSLGLMMAGNDREEALQAAREALKKVDIAPALHHRLPAALSGGQRQRVGIARAIVAQPDLMLWDEPTASLDPILVQEVLTVMEELVVTTRAGMLIVTHELPFALRLADRLVIMEKGRIAEEGAPETILTKPNSEVGAGYRRLWQARFIDRDRIRTPRSRTAARGMPIRAAGSSLKVQKKWMGETEGGQGAWAGNGRSGTPSILRA
ncbi:MAG: amino acid ABC transporter ATP-binding protein [Limnochordia bacterium]